MSEWSTYRFADFLMFSASSYWRLIELYNRDLWPAHLAALASGLVVIVLAVGRRPWGAAIACGGLAVAWLWVAWAFHLQRFADINTVAPAFAGAFAMGGLLLVAAAALGGRRPLADRSRLRRVCGIALLVVAVVVEPMLAGLAHRPWTQAEVFAMTPDPTVMATLGTLLLLPHRASFVYGRGLSVFAGLLWIVPLVWAALSGATLWTLGSAQGLLLPAAALLALSAAAWPEADPRP